jgi:hypothetical protein
MTAVPSGATVGVVAVGQIHNADERAPSASKNVNVARPFISHPGVGCRLSILSVLTSLARQA